MANGIWIWQLWREMKGKQESKLGKSDRAMPAASGGRFRMGSQDDRRQKSMPLWAV